MTGKVRQLCDDRKAVGVAAALGHPCPMSTAPSPHLLNFGLGYGVQALARRRRALGWGVAGGSRKPEVGARLQAEGIEAIASEAEAASCAVIEALADARHLLSSVLPDA